MDMRTRIDRLIAVLGDEGRLEVMAGAEPLIEREPRDPVLDAHLKSFREGCRAVLASLLFFRFGALPADVRARLSTASVSQINHWIRPAALAPTLAEVFDEP